MGFISIGRQFISQIVALILTENFFETKRKELLVLALLLLTFTFNGFLEIFKLLIEEIIG